MQVDINDLQYAKQLGFNPKGVVDPVRDGKIIPNTTIFWLEGVTFLSIAHIKPVYYQNRMGEWRPLSEVTTFHGNKRIELNERWVEIMPAYLDWLTKRQALLGQVLTVPTPFGELNYKKIPSLSIGMTVTTVYPDPDPETTTVDSWGRVLQGGGGATWTTLSNAAGNYADPSDTAFYVGYQDNATNDRWTQIYRSITLFDTSAVGGDTKDSGIYSLYATGNQNDASSNLNANVYECSPASNTNIVASDMTITNFTNTKLATGIARGSITTSAYNDWTLNASGLTAVNGSGVSKLSCLVENDIDDSAPSHDNSGAAGFSRFYGSTAEVSGTSQDPKLAITHTAGGGGSVFVPKVIEF